MSQTWGQFENFRSSAQRVTRIAKRDHNARYLLAEPAKIADTIRSIDQPPLEWSRWNVSLSRYSPDESQTGINVRVFPVLLQDRRKVLTATSTSGNPNAWSRVRSGHFPWHLDALLLSVALECMTSNVSR